MKARCSLQQGRQIGLRGRSGLLQPDASGQLSRERAHA